MKQSSTSGSIAENHINNDAVNNRDDEHVTFSDENASHLSLAKEPLLANQDESIYHTIDIQGDQAAIDFVNAVHAKVKLPKKISWSHVPAALFATATTAAGSFLYAMGGKMLGIKYEVGGIGINIPQNIYYGLGTAEFFSESYKNFRKVWGRCIAATTLGVAATLPSAVASWKLSDGGWFGYVQTGLTFCGNLPNNIYGMYDGIKRPLDYKNDNPRVRAFLVAEYRKSIPEEYRNILSTADRSLATVIASRVLGVSLGTGLIAAQTGYICSSSRFLGDVVKNEGVGVALGVLANSPTMLIAFLMSGFDLAKDSVELSADIYQHLTGNKKIPMTEGDKIQYATFATIFAGCAYMAYYSSATSQILYDGNCPSFGNPLSAILRESSVEGSQAFNQIMTSKAFLALLRHLKMAYDTNSDESRNIYRIRMTDLFFKASGSREELEEIARAHFPNRVAEWQKTAPVVAPEAAANAAEKKSYYNSVTSLFGRKKADAAENPVLDAAPVKPKSCCASFMGLFGYGNKPAPVVNAQNLSSQPELLNTAPNISP